MQFDRAKLKTVILYTCVKCDPSRLGAVKLNKVLYYADMLRYAETGTPLTGATYRKLPFGPTCDQLNSTLAELVGEGAIEPRESQYFGYRKKEYISRRSPDIERMNVDESQRPPRYFGELTSFSDRTVRPMPVNSQYRSQRQSSRRRKSAPRGQLGLAAFLIFMSLPLLFVRFLLCWSSPASTNEKILQGELVLSRVDGLPH
jgi:hypothetical protein